MVLCLPLLACGEGEVTEEESADELSASAALSKKADLGRRIFFDTTLSVPAGQSCASCHALTPTRIKATPSRPTVAALGSELGRDAGVHQPMTSPR